MNRIYVHYSKVIRDIPIITEVHLYSSCEMIQIDYFIILKNNCEEHFYHYFYFV